MEIYIKNMVCNRCITAVRQELTKLRLETELVQLGRVKLAADPTAAMMQELAKNLSLLGFELLDDARQQLIEKIKTIIIEQVHHGEGEPHSNFSEKISKTLLKDYSYLSALFSATEGITIEKYMISQKIEKVKELIIYDELSLAEIAYQMGYSSPAYLSNQFKKITGLTPGQFRKLGLEKRRALDSI